MSPQNNINRKLQEGALSRPPEGAAGAVCVGKEPFFGAEESRKPVPIRLREARRMHLKNGFCKSLEMSDIGKSPTPLTELKRLACPAKLSFAGSARLTSQQTETNQTKTIS